MTDPAPTSVHRIRLRGPWEWAVPTPISTQAWTWNRIRLPDEWDCLPAILGPVWFRRRFQAPTGITGSDRIRIVISTTRQSISVILNGRTLTPLAAIVSDVDEVIRFDITSLLSDRSNLLEIVLPGGISPQAVDSGLGQPVVIEIESMPLP